MARYQIVRFHFRGPSQVMKRGLTLEEAQAHCNNPETSSQTATSPEAKGYTLRHGMWFDGYNPEGEAEEDA